jgi:hypothetical protein
VAFSDAPVPEVVIFLVLVELVSEYRGSLGPRAARRARRRFGFSFVQGFWIGRLHFKFALRIADGFFIVQVAHAVGMTRTPAQARH